MSPLGWLRAAMAATSLLATGCALTSKATVVPIRYFTPEASTAAVSSAAARAPSTFELRLGRVTSGAHLRDRIAYRNADHELGYYEDRRWTERPEIYAQRGLARSLFEEGPFMRSVLSSSAPTLEVDVIAFEEVKLPSSHAARIKVRIVIADERAVLLEETLTAERPVTDTKEFEGVVDAMEQALDAVIGEITQRAQGALRARAGGGSSSAAKLR